jgi:iron complex outermembrane receptor protein
MHQGDRAMKMDFKEKTSVCAVRAALVVFVGSTLVTAHAQQTTATTDDTVQRVTITGSNIKSVEVEPTSPIQVISAKDIRNQGVTNVADLIGNLSASSGANSANGPLSDIAGTNSFAPGASNVGLRNLGEQSTLVLLNGRRLPSYALADFTNVFVNVDAIPIDAIERIEILKTGASAIYGSDAVAGVINIITKKDYQGIDVSADHTESLQSKSFITDKASITGGFGDYDKDGYNVLLNADFFKRNNVMWEPLLQYTNPALTKYSPSFGSFSSYSYPGNIIDGPNTQPVAGCAPNLIIGGLCKYDRYQAFQAVPESQRANFFASGTYDLGGGTQAFGEALYSNISTKYISAKPYYGDSLNPAQWGNPATGQALTFNYLALPASSPLNPTGDDGVGFRYRFVDAPAYQNVDSDEYRVLGGLRGTFNHYDWEVAAGVLGSKTTTTQQGAFSSSGFISEIGNYNNYVANLNPNVNTNFTAADPLFFAQPNGYHPGQANSATVLNTLFPVFGYSGKDSQAFADAKISGSLFKLPAGSVDFAVGGEVRHEDYSITPSANLANGDIVGYGMSQSDAGRNTAALYSEFNIPVFKNFSLSAAARLDKYPNISAHVTPRLAFRYTPSDSVLIRGTLENGFRAPNLVESATSVKYAYLNGTTDPQRCPQANALANDLYALAALPTTSPANAAIYVAQAESIYANECSFGLANKTLNNPNLQPETSKTMSFGIVLEPVKGYTASADYWHIDRTGTIGDPSTSQLLSGAPLPAGISLNRAPLNPNADPTFTAAQIAQYGVTAGPLLNLTEMLINISHQITSGIDYEFKGVSKIPNLGKLTTTFDGTYLLSYKDSSISDITENLVGQYGYSHFTANMTFALETGAFTNGLRFNYQGGYSLQLGKYDTQWNPAVCAANKVSSCSVAYYQTIDYFFAYTGIKNLVVGVNVKNIFNQLAPADLRAFGLGGIIPASLQDAQGRMLRLSLAYKFK